MRQRAKRALNAADAVILCLPDDAAREAVSLIDNPQVRVIDASTAHRVAEGWAYGFAELMPDGYQKIAAAKRVANPGCWATGFLALARPLVRDGLLPADYPVTVHGVSGYSGGGKSMITEFEQKDLLVYVETVQRGYALGLAHKHIPEMTRHARLTHPPLFAPSVGAFIAACWWKCRWPLWALPGKISVSRYSGRADRKPIRNRPLVKVAGLEEAAAMNQSGCRNFGGQQPHKAFCFRQ